MVENWAYTASLDAVATDSNDPDRPLAGHLIKNAKKPARTGLAMILYVREEDCLRRNITNYLADASPTGEEYYPALKAPSCSLTFSSIHRQMVLRPPPSGESHHTLR
jgi:hypothetical protein